MTVPVGQELIIYGRLRYVGPHAVLLSRGLGTKLMIFLLYSVSSLQIRPHVALSKNNYKNRWKTTHRKTAGRGQDDQLQGPGCAKERCLLHLLVVGS